MRFRREKAWLLGWMALIAPIPLPFNEVVEWPAVIAFMLAAALFLYRTDRGIEDVLPYWAMNLLALAYIPFLVSDLSALKVGNVLRPLVHLALYGIAVKLFSLRAEKDKWHLFLGIFFLFVGSMGTSVHPAAIVYLGVFGALSAFTMIRFAGLHSVATLTRSTGEPSVPLRRFLTGTVLLSVTAAIPLFFFLPRLRQPYVYVPTGGAGGAVQVSGFSDRLDLGMIDRVRSLRTVVFRFAYETPPPPATEMRFKVATYDNFTQDGWRRERSQSYSLSPARDGFFHIYDSRPVSWMRIWLRQGNNRMPLPVETTTLDLIGNGVVMDEAGEARFLLPKPGTVEYRAGMAAEPVVAGRPTSIDIELDTGAVSDRMAALAAEVMAGETLEERIRSLESHLRSEFSYSLDPVNSGPAPVESFLFETRQGHCEYFASAMVLLLRSQGVPARLATGYLGGDYNPLEEYVIVRQANAHAWVEAYLPDRAEPGEPGGDGRGRWTVFDPTPADARPQSGRPGWATLLAQAYDYMLFRWDRYVLTYGFGDQLNVLVKLRDAWLGFWRSLTADRERAPAPDESVVEEPEVETLEPEARPETAGRFGLWRAAPFLLVVLAAGLWFWFRRERFSATQAYKTIRGRAGPDGGDPPPAWLGPLKIEKDLLRRYPEAAQETRLIVSRYVRESFAGEELDDEELDEVRAALKTAGRKLKKTA